MNSEEIRVVPCDFKSAAHRQAVGDFTNGYICDEMGGGPPLGGEEKARLVEMLSCSPAAFVLIAEAGGEAVGLLTSFEYIATFAARPMLYVHDLYVERRYRGHGVARRLMEEAIAEARRRGCKRLSLEVREDNPHAQALYYKLGFRQTSPVMLYERLEL
jgi:ribosomal protein S18 acetylase RimI-like enzyme